MMADKVAVVMGLAPEDDTARDFTSLISGKLGFPIATGCFGDVHRCTIESSIGKMEVAVKVFKIGTRSIEKLEKTMLRDLNVWLKLRDPTIVPLLGTAQVESPLLALVSQWIPSGKLYDYICEQATTITLATRVRLVEGIAKGVDYLHSENVIHGNLHPGNVLIDDSGNTRLADFGLIVAEEPEELGFNSRWRAPEEIIVTNDGSPERPTFKSDIYSFGSVMFFVISGNIPWKEKKHVYLEPLDRAIHARPYNILGFHWALIQHCWTWESWRRLEATKVLQLISEYRQKTPIIASLTTALASSNYGAILAKCCKAKLEAKLWDEALMYAQEVTEFDPSSNLGYQLKYEALGGAQRYDEAIKVFKFMLSKLNHTRDPEMEALRQRYISGQEVVKEVIDAQTKHIPPDLLNTSTGLLCGRSEQINLFMETTEYKEVLFLTVNHGNFPLERIRDVVRKFFQYVMLSHRREENESNLYQFQNINVYEMDPGNGVGKFQSFCKVAGDRGYHWAWGDLCCGNGYDFTGYKDSNPMFVWYHHSALTIIYLWDVLPSSKSGALAKSVWTVRAWTLQEFLAPRVVLFYQKDWTLYLNDHTPNHKESVVITQELAAATGIIARQLIDFSPEMKGAREKLRWSSMRVTTLPEDIIYSLFGIFGVDLSPIYGEGTSIALGRLLQEIIAQSGDITCLDWVGESSEFNSCLPASITSYAAPPFVLPYISDDKIQTSLRGAGIQEFASQLYTKLDRLTPRFAQRRLHLPCIAFVVTGFIPQPGQQKTHFTYAIKADGLSDLLITTQYTLIPSSCSMPTQQTFLLIRPWDRNLLELSDSESDMQDLHMPGGYDPLLSGPYSRALRLIVHLVGQPFSALLLAQQRGGEYKRIASDCNIIARVKDVASIHATTMDVRTLEIL